MSDIGSLSDEQLRSLHLQSLSDAELKAMYSPPETKSWADTAMDAFKSYGTGALEGATGLIPDAAVSGRSLQNLFRQKLNEAYGGNKLEPLPTGPSGEEVSKKIETALGIPEPTNQAARRIGNFMGNPMSYIGGPESLAAKGVMAGLSGVGSYGGEAIGNKLAGPTGGEIGSFAGALAGGALAPVQAAGRYANQAKKVSAEIGPQNMTAGDWTGNKVVRAWESELSPRANEKQADAVKQAAFNRVGEVIGDRELQGKGGAVDTMLTRVGKKFDNLQSQSYAHLDAPLVRELQDVHSTFNSVKGLYPQETVDAVNGAINRILDVGHTGTIAGENYQTLRSNLSKAARSASDPQKAEGLHDIVNALDDATERSLSQTNPQLAGEWAKARKDYTNALVLERWANSPNQTPATLAQAAKAVYGKRQYVRGRDDFSDFAESARNVLRQFPDSGTAMRTIPEQAAKGIGAAIGAGAGLGTAQYMNQGNGNEPVIPFLAGEAGLGYVFGRPMLRAATMNPLSQALLRRGLQSGGPDFDTRFARALAQTMGQ